MKKNCITGWPENEHIASKHVAKFRKVFHVTLNFECCVVWV